MKEEQVHGDQTLAEPKFRKLDLDIILLTAVSHGRFLTR